MKSDFTPFIKDCLQKSAKIKIETARHLSQEINQAAKITIKAYQKGNKVLLCGNGGSAADCQHLAAELVGRFKEKRMALPAIALTTDTSILTAIANDYGYNFLFNRQIEALGQKGDILYALSTSGESINIINAVKTARGKKIFTIGLLGSNGGKLKNIVDLPIVVPAKTSELIQETHITIGHVICRLIEKELFK